MAMMITVMLALEDKPEVKFDAGKFHTVEQAKRYRDEVVADGYCGLRVVYSRILEPDNSPLTQTRNSVSIRREAAQIAQRRMWGE
jgi:hypothetical protein